MSNDWKDRLAGARMQVDQQFSDRVRASEFTNQQWGLIMTAVEFDIENPGDPATAELVANTDQVKHILPELENLPQGMGGPAAGNTGGSGNSSGGIIDRLKTFVGGDSGGGGVDEEKLQAASELTSEYASELQTFLEDQGRWQSLCDSAAATRD
jgi:hypothetical protein